MPSPRPTFDGPAHIPYAGVTRHLWGDAESGEVADWIYVSSDKIHQLVFGVPAGGAFRHSPDFRTVFAADEVYYVLEGTMVIANPETGEVHRVEEGEAAFFRRDTWHHAFSFDDKPLRVLEYFAPPPSTGSSSAYAKTRSDLPQRRYDGGSGMGRWPVDSVAVRESSSITVVRPADLLWRLEGAGQEALVGIIASTEHVTVGVVELLPGRHTDLLARAGDTAVYALSGTLNVRVAANDGPTWWELQPADGFYSPAGTPHQFYNVTGEPVRFAFGTAPSYEVVDHE